MQPTQIIKFEFNSLRNDCIFQRFSSAYCKKQVLPVFIQFYFIFSFCTKWCLMHHSTIHPEEIKNKVHIENSCFVPLIYCR